MHLVDCDALNVFSRGSLTAVLLFDVMVINVVSVFADVYYLSRSLIVHLLFNVLFLSFQDIIDPMPPTTKIKYF